METSNESPTSATLIGSSSSDPSDKGPADGGTYCPRCGYTVPFEQDRCPSCGHKIYHEASKIQRVGLLAGLGFIILAAILIFCQPREYHTVAQDVFEGAIILCVVGAGVGFFSAVVDMIRRGGE